MGKTIEPIKVSRSCDVNARDTSDAAVVIPQQEMATSSIYDIHSNLRRYVMLLTAAFVSIIVPFSDTVYLPALKAIQDDLRTSQALVAASVSIYMFTAGVASLVWGPASDRFGRRIVYFASSVAFIGSSFGCIYAPNIAILIVFRALQGAGVAGYTTNGSAVIADIFPPAQRGTASGVFMISMLIGPVIGPVLGGGLSDAFGWRSTMISLAVFGGLVTVMIAALVPETHQYIVLDRLQKKDPVAAGRIKEKEAIEQEPLVFHAPWVPLKYLIEPAIAPHSTVAFMSLGINLATLTELPAVLALPPYYLPATIIGIVFLADGVAGLIGSPLGGWISDRSAAAHPDVPEYRLYYNTLSTLIVMPAGLVIYAWSIHYTAHLSAIIVSLFLMAWAYSVYVPGCFGYLTTLKQSAAGAASAAVMTSMFVSSAVFILISSVVVSAIGAGPWFTVLAGLEFLVSAVAFIQIMRRKQRSTAAELVPDAGVELPSAAVAASAVAAGV